MPFVFQVLRSRATWILALSIALPAIAQPGPQELPTDAKDSLQNVTVNDSPEARKDIDIARGMEKQHEWNKAAGWYQEVLTKYRTRVVAWKADRQNVINSYRGIVYQVQESLAKWPTEGVNAYRARYESNAAAALESANGENAGAMQGVLDSYFLTESAKTAGMRLIELHLEAGEFDAAARVGQLLLEWYPADHLIAERPRLLFRTALALHLCGDDVASRDRANELKSKFADAKGTVFGNEVALNESLEKLLAVAPPMAQNLSPDSWNTFSGSPDRAHVSSAQGHMGARLFSIELPPRPTPKGQQQQAAEIRQRMQQEETEGRTLGIMPVVDSNALFFQDGSNIWAVGLDSGIPLTGWMQTYGNRGYYHLKGPASYRNQQFTLTITDGAVLGILGQSNRMQAVYTNQGMDAGSTTVLVCLDRETGKERWKMAPSGLTGDALQGDERERLRALDLSGSPVVVGDNVYVIARGGKDLQFENCYVICLALNTGQYRWSSLVASSNTNFNLYANDPMMAVGTTSHLAYAGGRLYVATNLGAVASLDAANGSIVWLTLYRREEANSNDLMLFPGRGRRWAVNPQATVNIRPWEYSPVFVNDGKLFFLPTDSKYAFVYSATTGEELKQFDLDDFQPEGLGTADRPTALVGIVGEWLAFTASKHAYLINWKTYDTSREKSLRSNHESGAAFMTEISANADGGPSGIRGRAFVTRDSLYVPTIKNLFQKSIAPGFRTLMIYPAKQAWDENEGPGNIVVTSEHVVIAARNSIDVYTDMTLAKAKLDREIDAAPDEPEPRLHYAEVMFAAGQMDASLDRLKQAVERMGDGALRPGPNRQRLFNDALNFAQKLAKVQSAESVEAAISYYDIAARAADLPAEQVSYRLSRARFDRDNVQPDSFATAVKLYQEILSQPALRTVGVQPANETQAEARGQVQACVEAEAQIAEVIRQHPEAYDEVRKLAATAMESAKTTGDPAKLLAVAEVYPNAPSASQAMLLTADLYEHAGNPRLAAHVLRQVLQKYGNTSDKDRIIEAMVRNYLKLPGGIDIAIARLRRDKKSGEMKLAQAMTLPDGSTIERVTFREAARALEAVRPKDTLPPLPDVHVLPEGRSPTAAERERGIEPARGFFPTNDPKLSPVIGDVARLILPPPELPDATRNDRVVALIGNQLTLIAAGAGPLGQTDVLTDEPRAAWIKLPDGKSALLAWSNNEIALLNGDNVAPLWVNPLKSLPAAETITSSGMRNTEVAIDTVPATDPNAQEETPVFLNGRRQRGAFNLNRPFRAGAGFIQAQAVDVELPVGVEQIWKAQPLSDRVIFATSGGRVACLDLPTGKMVWQTRLSITSKPVERLVASDDFTAVKINDEGVARIYVLDNYNGQIRMIRQFGDTNSAPVNMALSTDGMLVWTLPDRICGKDLYEPDPTRLTFEEHQGMPNVRLDFADCNKVGQLQIKGHQIVAVANHGRYVSVHSLEDGKVNQYPSSGDIAMHVLTPGAGQGALNPNGEVTTSIRLVGPCLYVTGPRSLMAYHLDEPGRDTWRPAEGDAALLEFRATIPTKDYLMMVSTTPTRRVENTARIFMLKFYMPVDVNDPKHTLGGSIVRQQTVTELAGISTWQAVNGGVYYLSDDHKLHFLRGTEPH